MRINTYQYGDRVFTNDAFIHSGSNKVTLQYLSGLIDTGEFPICVESIIMMNQHVILDTSQKLNNQNIYSLTYS